MCKQQQQQQQIMNKELYIDYVNQLSARFIYPDQRLWINTRHSCSPKMEGNTTVQGLSV